MVIFFGPMVVDRVYNITYILYRIVFNEINYILRKLFVLFLDINECETLPDLCTNGRCINTLGSYRCSCNKAYKVDHTGTHCNGK